MNYNKSQSPSTKAFSLSLENQELHKKLELLGGTDAAELLDLNIENQQVIADQEKDIARLKLKLSTYQQNQAKNEKGLENINKTMNKFKDEAEVRRLRAGDEELSKLESLEKENARLTSSLTSSSLEISTLTSKVKSLESSLDKTSSQTSHLNSKIHDLSSLNASLKSSSLALASSSSCEVSRLKLSLSLKESLVSELMESNVALVEEGAEKA
ncbi:hypothetical protein TrRE_jg12244, partial [Triparma retinervis]